MEKGPIQSGFKVIAWLRYLPWFVVLLSTGTLWGDEPTSGSPSTAPAFQPAEIWVGGKLVSGPQLDPLQPPVKPEHAHHAELSESMARQLIHALNYSQPNHPNKPSIRPPEDAPSLDSKPAACADASSDSLQIHPPHDQAGPEDSHVKDPDISDWQPVRRPTPPSNVSSTANHMPANDEVRPIAVFAPSAQRLRAASEPVPRSTPLAADSPSARTVESPQPQTAPAMQQQAITGEFIAAAPNTSPVPVGYVSSTVSLDHSHHGHGSRTRDETQYEPSALQSNPGRLGVGEPDNKPPATALTNLLPTTVADLLNGVLLGITLSVFTLGVVGLLLWRQNAVFRIEVLHATPNASQAPVVPTPPLAGHAGDSQRTQFNATPGSQPRGSHSGPSRAAARGQLDTHALQPFPSWEVGPEMLLSELETTFDQRRKQEEQLALDMESAMLDEIFAENLKLRDVQAVTA